MSINLVSIFRCFSPPHNPVYVRRVDPSAVAFRRFVGRNMIATDLEFETAFVCRNMIFSFCIIIIPVCHGFYVWYCLLWRDKVRAIYECRCDERLRSQADGSTRLTYTGLSWLGKINATPPDVKQWHNGVSSSLSVTPSHDVYEGDVTGNPLTGNQCSLPWNYLLSIEGMLG